MKIDVRLLINRENNLWFEILNKRKYSILLGHAAVNIGLK